MDYLSVITAEEAEITLDGEQITVRRAKLGLWFRLQEAQFQAVQPGEAGFDSMFEIVSLATGKPLDWVKTVPSLGEVLDAIKRVSEVNRPRGDLPYMHAAPGQGDGWDYPNRGLAVLVHKLAATYGWSRRYILEEVYPEEAFCYMQEILLDAYTQRMNDYYTNPYLGVDNQGHKEDFPPLPWPTKETSQLESGKKEQMIVPTALIKRGFIPPGAIKLIVDEKGDLDI